VTQAQSPVVVRRVWSSEGGCAKSQERQRRQGESKANALEVDLGCVERGVKPLPPIDDSLTALPGSWVETLRELAIYQIRCLHELLSPVSQSGPCTLKAAKNGQPVGEFKLLTGIILVPSSRVPPLEPRVGLSGLSKVRARCFLNAFYQLSHDSSLPTVSPDSLQVVIPSDLPSTRPWDTQARPMEVLQCSVKGRSWWTIHSLFINQFEELGRGPFRRRLGATKIPQLS
jgi:hypothetical protein